jgi:hypothetical protein
VVVSATANLFLFSYNDLDVNTHSNLRIFACKIYEAGVLVRNYVPCYRKSDNVAGLYDLVNNGFYTNSGTGTFTVGADYVNQPSIEQPIEIQSVGDKTKNLLNYKDLFDGESTSMSGITYTKTDKGILVNGTSTGFASTSLNIDLKSILEVGKTYIISGSTVDTYVVFYSQTNGVADYSGTKTITGEEGQISVYLQTNKNVTVDNVLITPQLEEGTVATAYEPYGYKIPINTYIGNLANNAETHVLDSTTNIYLKEPLRKIDDYADYIDYKSKKVVRNIYKTFFDGSSDENWNTWGVNNQTTGITGFYSYLPRDGLLSSKSNSAICNILSYNSNSWGGIDVGCGVATTGDHYIMMSVYNSSLLDVSSSANAITSFRTLLENIGVNFYHILATPTEETIEIPTIETFDGTTIFDVETTIEPSGINVNYWKQI